MKPCVVYFSRTGNTKRFAQAIGDAVKAPVFDLSSTQPSALAEFDVLILGTPVEGASPAKETAAYIESLPKVVNKKVFLFCTYRVFGNERTVKKMEKDLKDKGYVPIGKVSKKGMNPDKQADFSKEIAEVQKVLT